MHYIVQEDIFREANYGILIESLNRLGLSYDIVRIFPFVNKVVNIKDIPDVFDNVEDLPDYIAPDTKVFCFGAIKLARIGQLHNWYPGSMMNTAHDYSIYSLYYKENLVNYDSEIFTFSSPLVWNERYKFIRPTMDTKSFTGAVYTEYDWKDLVKSALLFKTELLNENTIIQVSSVKNIQKEIRFWVIGGKIITGSQYRLGKDVIYDSYYDFEAEIFAQKMVDLYQIADCFVIDICLHDDVWKIVECNCLNASGFYLSNVQKMLMELEYFYEH